MLGLLVDSGADVNAKTYESETALMWATDHGDAKKVRLLIENCADVNAKDTLGMSALMWAAKYGNLGVVELLVENGADVNACDKKGASVLMYAKRLVKLAAPIYPSGSAKYDETVRFLELNGAK